MVGRSSATSSTATPTRPRPSSSSSTSRETAPSPFPTVTSPPSSSPARTRRPATAGRPGSSARRRRRRSGPRRRAPQGLVAILVLTAVELEARALARALSLPSLPSLSFPAFGRGTIRVAPVGLRAGLLSSRWTALVSASDRPLVVSAGVCGGLDPTLRAGDLVLPDGVISDGGLRLPVTGTVEQRAAAAGGGLSRTGLMATASLTRATPGAKAGLRAATGAVAGG